MLIKFRNFLDRYIWPFTIISRLTVALAVTTSELNRSKADYSLLCVEQASARFSVTSFDSPKEDKKSSHTIYLRKEPYFELRELKNPADFMEESRTFNFKYINLEPKILGVTEAVPIRTLENLSSDGKQEYKKALAYHIGSQLNNYYHSEIEKQLFKLLELI